MDAKQKLEIAVQALRDVVDPIAKIQREMPKGHRLDGAGAIDHLRNPGTYQAIAREALKKLRRKEW